MKQLFKPIRARKKQVLIDPQETIPHTDGIHKGLIQAVLLLVAGFFGVMYFSGGIFIGSETSAMGANGRAVLRCRYLTFTGIAVKNYWHDTGGLLGQSSCGVTWPSDEGTSLAETPKEGASRSHSSGGGVQVAGPESVTLPFVLTVDGRARAFAGTCKALPKTGEARARWADDWSAYCQTFPGSCQELSGSPPKSFQISADAITCRIRADGRPGPLTVRLRQGNRVLDTVTGDVPREWIDVRSTGPWDLAQND